MGLYPDWKYDPEMMQETKKGYSILLHART